MKRLPNIQNTPSTIAVMLAALICGCSGNTETDVNQDSNTLTTTRGEHDRDRGEVHEEDHGEHDRDGTDHHGEEGEESGTELSMDESYDDVRNGARLVLAYDAQTNSFNGSVENITEEKLERVRVEVHLSNGKELGPTTPADLGPGDKRDVKLAATSNDFDGWTAHPEVGSGEHGHKVSMVEKAEANMTAMAANTAKKAMASIGRQRHLAVAPHSRRGLR